jgi:hypothetical protein
MLMADGRVEELHFTGNGDSPELLLPLQYNGSSALAIVPGATVDLRFTLQPQQVSAAAPPEQSHRDATPDNEWRNVLCQRHARSHARSALPSSDATRRSSAPPKAQTVSQPS